MTKWSPGQDVALREVSDWYNNRRHEQQTFRLFGCAGTGKSTLAKHFAEGIEGTVKFAAFTGKAAHVMAKKGCEGATTIHRMIYIPKSKSKVRLRELEKELDHHKAAPEPDFEVIAELEQEITKEQQNTSRMSFALNMESDLKHAKLLIVDEVSMVSDQMGKDLESFGTPILVLGDPEQLPPIFGAGYFTEKPGDIVLTEIHRQALDNPIIAMSKLVREGHPLQLGIYGNSRVVAEALPGDDILTHDIILTGLRKTKKACDDRSRVLRGKIGLPMKEDRLICVKNNHDMGLLNGQMWTCLENAVPLGGGLVSLHLKALEEDLEIVVCAAECLFQGLPLDRWDHEEDIQEFEYAYAITVHKSQGSQWDNVLLFDQKDRFNNWSVRDRQRWLYTGITRAAERITVMRL